jgi:hypothetical protein
VADEEQLKELVERARQSNERRTMNENVMMFKAAYENLNNKE